MLLFWFVFKWAISEMQKTLMPHNQDFFQCLGPNSQEQLSSSAKTQAGMALGCKWVCDRDCVLLRRWMEEKRTEGEAGEKETQSHSNKEPVPGRVQSGLEGYSTLPIGKRPNTLKRLGTYTIRRSEDNPLSVPSPAFPRPFSLSLGTDSPTSCWPWQPPY